ncbi:hypothetical protein [Elizabethkingia meningoseptica]|uniref:hypothetical protein n=1 Tax=Elizabethkingia meningoseptica TaxID=238 RepID=UPI003158E23C
MENKLENHQNKLQIFDEYAQNIGYSGWVQLVNMSFANEVTEHTLNVCDIVQDALLINIKDNARVVTVYTEECEFLPPSKLGTIVDKESILDKKNKIQ